MTDRKAYFKEYYSKPENKERRKKYWEEYKLKNADKIKEYENKEETKIIRKAANKSWRKNNPDKVKIWKEKNRDKILEKARLYNAKPEVKERIWELEIKRLYDVTPEWYYKTLIKQNNKCFICETTEPGNNNKKFCIDHYEIDGKPVVRGLLCIQCNQALGKLKHNILLFEKCIKYLKRE